jgi:hypothetical protein
LDGLGIEVAAGHQRFADVPDSADALQANTTLAPKT